MDDERPLQNDYVYGEKKIEGTSPVEKNRTTKHVTLSNNSNRFNYEKNCNFIIPYKSSNGEKMKREQQDENYRVLILITCFFSIISGILMLAAISFSYMNVKYQYIVNLKDESQATEKISKKSLIKLVVFGIVFLILNFCEFIIGIVFFYKFITMKQSNLAIDITTNRQKITISFVIVFVGCIMNFFGLYMFVSFNDSNPIPRAVTDSFLFMTGSINYEKKFAKCLCHIIVSICLSVIGVILNFVGILY
jgi:hypothetical protein